MPVFGRPKQKPISDDDVLRIMELLDGAWLRLEAAAWQGYEGYGRGFLFMDFAADKTKYVPGSSPHVAVSRDPR